MIRNLSILIIASLLMACEPQKPVEITYVMPPELSDCKVHAIDSSSGPKLYVVRCSGANKQTETAVEWSQSSGKTTTYYHTVLVDGVEYKKQVGAKAPTDKITIDGVEYVKVSK